MVICKDIIKGAVSAALSCILLCSCSAGAGDKGKTEELFLLDTYVSITSFGASDNGAKELLSELDKEFSRTYSEKANAISGENVRECAEASIKWNSTYSDYFEGRINFTCGALTQLWGISGDAPRVPSESEIKAALETITDETADFASLPSGTMLDFGASAKGFACDKAKELLDTANARCEIISLGSSTLLYGEKTDKTPFRAAVKNPLSPSEYLGIIETPAAFISTSGGYERCFEENGVKYEHILSPQTGRPVETDLCSVTVVAPSDMENGGIYTDLLATAIYSCGSGILPEFAAAYPEFGIVAADIKKTVYVSSGVDFTLYENTGFKLKENP